VLDAVLRLFSLRTLGALSRKGRGATRAANRADQIASVDFLTKVRMEARHVRIARHHAIAMRDFDGLAIATAPASECHFARGCGIDGSSIRAFEIQA